MSDNYINLPVQGGNSGSGVDSLNGLTGALTLVAGTGITIVPLGTNITISAPGTGGTVTSVSVVSANGLAGTVATATTTPAITLSTTITGILQGNGTAISAATIGNITDAGTDGIVITGGTNAVLGSGVTIAQHVADTTHNGYLSSTDWNTFNGKQAAGNYITALTGDGTATGPGSVAFTLATVNSNVGSFGDATHVGAFTVNGKGLITAAASTAITFPVTSVNGNTGAVTVNAINQLTGDGTAGPASGSQSQALTLVTVNGNIGSFGSSTSIPNFTVNAKGLITAAGSNVVIAPAGTLSGNTLNSGVVTSSLTAVGTVTTGTWASLLGPYTEPATTSTTVNGTFNIDWSTKNIFQYTQNGNTTFTFSNPPSSGTSQVITLFINPVTFTTTWPASVKWGTAGTPTLSASKVNIISLTVIDGGTNYYGTAVFIG